MGAGSHSAYTHTNYEYLGGPVANVTAYDESGAAVRNARYTYTAEGQLASVTGSTQPAIIPTTPQAVLRR